MACIWVIIYPICFYCTGKEFYPMSLIDRNIDNKNTVCFGVLTPQSWFKINEVAFLGLIIWKRRGATNLLMPDLNCTPKINPRYEFSMLWGVPLQNYGPLNIIIHTAPHFWRRPPPLKFRTLLRENDRDYDAQNFRIFISHHYLPPHLKRKKSMTCCGAHPRCWHGIAHLF